MTLKDWMEKNDVDILQASESFGASIFAVKKWLRGERTPRPSMQAKIKRATKGAVTGDDWVPKE